MTNSILRTLTNLCLAATFSSVALLAQGCMTATVPFNFTADKLSFPAGEYCLQPVRQDSSVLLIRTVNGGSSAMIMTVPANGPEQSGRPVLKFKVYGDSHFLYQVAGSTRVWQFHRSANEELLIARKAQATGVTVAADFSRK